MKELQKNKGAGEVWVNHITGNTFLPGVETYITPKIDGLIEFIANELQGSHDISKEDALAMATNMITGEALRRQRGISPSGHLALFTSCLAYHPDLSDFRRNIAIEARKDKVRLSDFIDYRSVFLWATSIGVSVATVALYNHFIA